MNECVYVCGRMCARPGNKRYGIPSVVFQLYGAVKMEFKIPPSVFYPVPKVLHYLVRVSWARLSHPPMHVGFGGASGHRSH
jgi:16S rRNA A1518/A1519 N6-dimethyltransferase RsmA/KsgA/DIM1 with predicted DNA glycosylase/AP lyase activity